MLYIVNCVAACSTNEKFYNIVTILIRALEGEVYLGDRSPNGYAILQIITREEICRKWTESFDQEKVRCWAIMNTIMNTIFVFLNINNSLFF
jgi:hypothetical protein